MTIWNLGSINADHVYSVPHVPAPGETLASTGRQMFLGGKGANMSVAAARAGAHVRHIGAVGPDGLWMRDRLTEWGVDTRSIAEIETESGVAVIMVDPAGENGILLHPGANHRVPRSAMQGALAEAATGDIAVFQNETNLQADMAELAAQLGLRVAYAAAPFDPERVTAVMDHLDLLFLNAVEAEQLRQATGMTPEDLPIRDVVVTLGSDGADWFGPEGRVRVAPIRVEAVDTTGAGDTFTGYVLAGLDRGMPMAQALDLATRAAALMVTRPGTADAIPDLSEVQAFRG